MRRFGILIFTLLGFSWCFGQENSGVRLLSSLHYGINQSVLDLNKRFGSFFDLGTQVTLLLPSDYTLSLGYSFLFGSQVREDVLAGIRTDGGGIISNSLVTTFPLSHLRGNRLSLLVGKWVKFESNHDLGLEFSIGPGLLNHRIHFADDMEPLAQLRDSYRNGYNRFSQGPGVASAITFQYISENRQISFYTRLHAGMYWTKNITGFNLDSFMEDIQIRNDGLVGIQAGWIFPLIF